jgi:iron complex outermembrane receptor protein
VRGKLLLTPAAGLQLDLRFNVIDFAAGATYDSIVTKPSIIVQPDENMLGRTTGHTADYSAKVQYEMPWATLTSITGYTDLKENYRGDLDFTNPVTRPGVSNAASQIGQGQNLGVRMTSQELRLTSPDSQPVRWIGGVYYLNTKRDLETRVFWDTNGSNDQWDDMGKNIVRLNESNDNTASAVFGQLDVDLAKQWTLSTALRYDRDKRHQNDLLGGTSREAEFSKWQPKLTLTHTLDANALLYGTLSTGFRSGGFNAPGIGNYKPETLTNAEMGMKTTLMDGRLLFNAAVFASKSDNLQFFYVDVKSGSQIISNIDSVDLKGVDIDFRYLPMRGLEFDGGLGITDSTITRDLAEPGAVGNHTPKAVPFKINLGAQCSTALGNGTVGTLRLDYEHRDSKYWHPDNAAVSPPLNLLGLRATVADAKDKWSVTLAVRNLTDQRYYTDYTSKKYSGLGYDIGFLAPGRLVSLEAKTRF